MTQAMEALAMGNEVRYAAARFKRGVKAMDKADGYLALAEELRATELPEGVGCIRLDPFLRTARRIAEAKVPRVMREAEVQPYRRFTRIDSLTKRERCALAGVLEAWAAA